MNNDQRVWNELVERYGLPAVTDALAQLPPREREVITCRCGPSVDRPETLASIGQRWGVTQPRVGQVSARGLRRLRDTLSPRIGPWRETRRERSQRERVSRDQGTWRRMQERYGTERLTTAARLLPNQQCSLLFYRFIADFATDDYSLLARRLGLPDDPPAVHRRLRTALKKLDRVMWKGSGEYMK